MLNLLGKRKPYSNHYFLFGLLSSNREIQKKVLDVFDRIAPNKTSYQIVYRVACCKGFFTLLSQEHQTECIESIMAYQQDPLSHLLIGILLSDYPLSTIPICKSWLSIPDNIIRGYKNWNMIERQIQRDSLGLWDQVIGHVLPCPINNEIVLLDALEHSSLDQHDLFTLICIMNLNQAKPRILSCLDDL